MSLTLAGATAIGAGTTLLSNVLNNAVSAGLSEKQYRRALNLMYYQNEYNSPKEQIRRLREAGLNPNLIYGNHSTSTGNMSSADAPKYEPYNPHFDLGSIEQLTGVVMNAKALERQNEEIQNLRANRVFTNAQTQQALAQAINLQLGNYVSRRTLGYQIDAVAANTARALYDAQASKYSPDINAERLAGAILDNRLKSIDADLAEAGYNYRATGTIGTVVRLLHKLGVTPEGVKSYVENFFDRFKNGDSLSKKAGNAVDAYFKNLGEDYPVMNTIYENSKGPNNPGKGWYWLFKK